MFPLVSIAHPLSKTSLCNSGSQYFLVTASAATCFSHLFSQPAIRPKDGHWRYRNWFKQAFPHPSKHLQYLLCPWDEGHKRRDPSAVWISTPVAAAAYAVHMAKANREVEKERTFPRYHGDKFINLENIFKIHLFTDHWNNNRHNHCLIV